MKTKLSFTAALAFVALSFSGCGETTIVTQPPDRVEKKVIIKDNDTKTETKEKIVKENLDGSTTKIEKKTETK